jgi:Pectate lyase superfamily protein/Secretion system C-terminal sorting domain
MKKLIFILVFVNTLTAQTIPSARLVDWSLVNNAGATAPDGQVISITNYGGVGDGITPNDAAITAALAALGGNSGTIDFPAGDFFFQNPIVLPDSTSLRGQGANQTILRFDLGTVANDLIQIRGTISSVADTFAQAANKGDTIIVTNNAPNVIAGDWIKTSDVDTLLVTSTWAWYTTGQVIEVKAVYGDTVVLKSPLRRDYYLANSPRFRKINVKRECKISCLKIVRMDATVNQSSQIDVKYAVHCSILGVESENTNFAHASISASSDILLRGCHFHHAFAYGGGGQGYGVAIQDAVSECLIDNNCFNHLRHSMLVQAGSNGNVFAYNYSTDPFWASFPSNSAGDLVLHGNYPYSNLFEGNIGQNLVIDASHDENGPDNVYFRNRAELYGLVMSANPPSDNQIYVGNEIPNTSIFMGNYTLFGTGHFEFGNNVRGTITPANTTNLPEVSLYLTTSPSYFGSMTWPAIGTPGPYNVLSIPARDRYLSGNYTDCTPPVILSHVQPAKLGWKLYPNPCSNLLFIEGLTTGKHQIELVDMYGRIVFLAEFSGESIGLDIQFLSPGLYSVLVDGTSKRLVMTH